MATCENKVSLDNIAAVMKSKDTQSTWQSPPCGENWDIDNAQDSRVTPFILNDFGNTKPYDKSDLSSSTSDNKFYIPQIQYE
ncbi:protein D7-like [Pelobates fuscus]|uniref:protein D7-like n=1 Tax=Pelobates fuscus TaxID=191477 RepID=UPI002FE4C13C